MWLSLYSHFLWHLQDGWMKGEEGETHRVVSWLTLKERVLGKEARAGWGGGGCWADVCMCVYFGLWQRNNYSVSRHTKGMQGEIHALWVVHSHLPSPYRYYFILPFPPRPWNSPVCAVFTQGGSWRVCVSLCCSGNNWVLQAMTSLRKQCFCFLYTQFIVLIWRMSGVLSSPKWGKPRKNTAVCCFHSILVLVMYEHGGNKSGGLCGWSV